MEFVESPVFTKHVRRYLTDEEYSVLQAVLAAHPRMGDVIPGAAGLRKVRWGSSGQGRGKRGGLRVVYCLVKPNLIGLVHIYRKSDQDNLEKVQLKMLRQNMMGGQYE